MANKNFEKLVLNGLERADGTLSSYNHSAATRSNFYSRFAHERNTSPAIKPPLAPVEIINHHVKVETVHEGMSGEPAEGADVRENPATGFSSITNKPRVGLENPENATHLKFKNTDRNHDKPEILVKKLTRPSSYSKPSDMLEELRLKDEKLLREAVATTPFRRQKRWTHQNGKTSWNIFGVPTANYWTLK